MNAQSFSDDPATRGLYATFKPGWNPLATFLATPEGQRWTYADLDQITAVCVRRVAALGIGRGARVVALLERSPWNLFLYVSCLRAGIVFVPLSPQLTPAELAPVLADVEPALVVCSPALQARVRELAEAAGIPVLTLDADGSGGLSSVAPADTQPDADVKADDIAAIMFTSGTTGRPKGAVIPHGHLATKARSLVEGLGWCSSDTLLHAMPLHHAHGLFMTTHCVLTVGASILLAPRFDAAETVALLPSATVFSGVPTMYSRMASVAGLRKRSRNIRVFVCASAPLPPDVFQRFEQASGHQLLECWGMSETMTNTANPLDGPRRPSSAGKLLPGVEIRVTDADGRVLPPGRAGVLEIRSATRFGGYWRRSESEQPRFRDGYFVTGDIGSFDADGYLSIIGRTSDVIISGGNNVYPREVELALEQLAGVSKAAVFGLPHPDFGEAVAAAIEPAACMTLDQSALDVMRLALRERLSGYKVPKALFVVDGLPLTVLGKIQRSVLKNRFADHFSRAD
ncbi:AMP-binding protein [Paraburkholderia fungorum]|uniref:AMP-binding protein n=1 Tax=Paraburkholderia fungorum TaxID=134537 RepID=UPI0006272139|nr:AMP-binding protein [Paraburkholderia fungorum]